MGTGVPRRRAAGLVVALAFAGSMLGAATANARSQGFYVYNLTSTSMKLKTIQLERDGKFDREPTSPNPPKVGDVLMPGKDSGPKYDHNHIELERRLVAPFGVARLFYTNGQRDYGAYLDSGARRPYCEWFSPAPYCTTDPPSIYFLDPPGTTYEFPREGDSQKHAELLQDLCTNANLDGEIVTCDFEPTSAPDHTAFGSPHTVGVTVPNCEKETGDRHKDAENTIDVDLEESDKTGQENSWGIKFSVEAEFGAFVEKLKTGVETSYKGVWSTEHEFHGRVGYKVPPNHIGWVVAENPVIRVPGNLTLHIGNTTLKLRDIYIDNPDGSRNGDKQWIPRRPEMTAEQRKRVCPQGVESDAKAPASEAKITQKGTAGADTLYGGRESTTLLGRGGNDILLGGSGPDKLRGGGGNDLLRGGTGRDVLQGGPGRDVLRGGPGADRIADSGGRTVVVTGPGGRSGDVVDVRDGEGNDTVFCANRRTRVRADRRDRLHHCGRR